MTDLKQKHDDELWAMWRDYISAAGRIKREIDRRQRTTPFKRPGYKSHSGLKKQEKNRNDRYQI